MAESILNVWSSGINYADFRDLSKQHVKKGTTSGLDQTESLVELTKLNEARMRRLDKTIRLEDSTRRSLAQLGTPIGFLALTELWCADSAQLLPMFNKFAEITPRVEFRSVFRDEHPELMDSFLTNGGRAIPKIIVFDLATGTVLFTMGPRPEILQRIVTANKTQEEPIPTDEFNIYLQKWYFEDKTRALQVEFVNKLQAVMA
ncbi:MAG: thioredoxin family protein [Flavobacteriales bacterium]|nr:thioredoxin family protein [Flavobacteriales bacterium]